MRKDYDRRNFRGRWNSRYYLRRPNPKTETVFLLWWPFGEAVRFPCTSQG